jgi:uncharacterized protein (DUF1800 family)
MNSSLSWFRTACVAPCLCLVLVGVVPVEATPVDLNGNGMSDIWELVYGASGLDPNADTDGDGVSNLQESLAGTDPFDANSCPRITVKAVGGTNLSISIAGQLGKQYELQSFDPTSGENGSNWISEATQVLRAGDSASFTTGLGAGSRLFRLAVSDVDTDGDGVSDWEEYKLGLDPTKSASSGQIDFVGQAVSDYAYVTNALAAQNILSISATDPTSNQPDPGQPAVNLGLLTVSRGGFPLGDLTANFSLPTTGLGIALEGIDYAALPRSVYFPKGASYQTITVTPLANSNRASPVVATVELASGAGYQLGTSRNASVLIYPSATPTGTGLFGQYFTNSSSTYTNAANFNPTKLVLSRLDPTISFTWGNTTNPFPNSGYYTVRWTGQVQPQYSELYYFDVRSDDGVKLWVNDQLIINRWVAQSATDSMGSITLQAGVRYNIRLEYFNVGGSATVNLNWFSASQAKQLIPATRLYPATGSPSPTAVTSPLSAVAFVGQPFSFLVTAANSGGGAAATGLPPGLNFNAAAALISGVPNVSGDYQVLLTATNAAGQAASVLDLQVIETGSSVTREVWLGVPGADISAIPLATPANQTNFVGPLEGITGFGQDYGERVRGYFTAPTTGNYYFWIAGSGSAELWISNDSEPANKVKRAWVSPTANPAAPPALGTGPRQWYAQASQRSPWLVLQAGQRYYLEILHKSGADTNDNWSVGWLQDPTGTNYAAGGVVPGFVLGRYFPPAPVAIPGTLYNANLLAQSSALSSGVGTATLRVSADGSQAVLNFKYSGLSSPVTGEHVHCEPYLDKPSQIMFDIDAATPLPDGSYVWPIEPVGTLTTADVQEIIREGRAYLNIHTVNYPAGEINGHFTLASGTQAFAPPPAAPAWTDDHSSPNAATRFLTQATFGPSASEVAAVQALGYEGWINNQFSLPASYHLPWVLTNRAADPTQPYPSSLTFNTWWRQSIRAPDQLRQRVAFALSEIMVVSDYGILNNNGRALSAYYDVLLTNAFGNFREVLEAVTLSPAMGLYLDMRANDKGSITNGVHANENYAREVMQLFSIGLYRMWPDGTLVIDSQGNLVPTYNQNVIMGFASAFTGWNYYQTNQANGRLPTNFSPASDYIHPMILVPTHHDLNAKLLLDNVMLPPAWGSQANPGSANFDAYGLQDLELALDSIFNNQNVGPFICRQLIQRLVTSNPSRDYLYRVVQVFNDNGAGVRGDLQAVVKAILLDYEARSTAIAGQPTFGKQREPVLRATAVARAFPSPPDNGGAYSQTGTRTITVTTTNAHRLNTGDTLFLSFTDGSGMPAPNSQSYGVTVTSPTAFTITAGGTLSCTYTQSINILVTNQITSTTVTTNAIRVSVSGHGLLPGNPVYLAFTSGGASNGLYQVIWTNGANSAFSVVTANSTATSGNGLLTKLSAGGYTQSRTNINISVVGPHGLNAGDQVFLNFTAGSAVDGVYTVASVPDPTHFVVVTTNSVNQSQNGVLVYPLLAPPYTRSGSVAVQASTFSVGTTDNSLYQTPLRSPTVFNFFLPDFQFPGALASAGLTTPEFQLTSDTSVASQMNFLEGGLLNNTGNTNGLSSFTGGNGAMVLDLGPWMTPAFTANAGIPGLVDALSSLLMGGQLSIAAKTAIVNYIANTTNFPYTTPTNTQMRDRVRAVVHLLVTSPDFTVQK